METYLTALGVDVWISFASGYNASKKPKTATHKEAKMNNKLTIDTSLDGLTDSVKSKVGSCESAKYLWDKLQDLYSREEAKEQEEVEEITTSQISKKQIEVSSFSLIVKE